MASIVGYRIRLDPMTMQHHQALCEVGLDPTLWEATTISVSTPGEMDAYMRKALKDRDEGTSLPYVVIHLATGQVIGTTRFHHMTPDSWRMEIGFTWIAPRWQRQGLNTEAKYLMLRQAFERIGCARVELKADIDNVRSRKAIEAVGGKLEAILRNYMLSERKGARDLAVYSILDAEWPGVKSKLEQVLSQSVT